MNQYYKVGRSPVAFFAAGVSSLMMFLMYVRSRPQKARPGYDTIQTTEKKDDSFVMINHSLLHTRMIDICEFIRRKYHAFTPHH